MSSVTTAAGAGAGLAAGARRRVVVASDTDDYARFGEDAKRGVFLMKIPVDVMNIWRPLFENGGVETTRNTGARDLEPRVELGTIIGDGHLKNGSIFSFNDSQGRPVEYRVNMRPSTGMKSRVISAEVGNRGQNVKFEGIVEHTGQLMPIAADDAYKEILKERVELAEVKAQVRTIGQKEELEAMRKQGRVVIKGGGTGDDEDGAPEGKKRKTQKEDANSAGAAVSKPAPKKNITRKKEKDLSSDAIKERLLQCFDKVDPATGQKKKYWKKKELRQTTGVQLHKMQPILEQIAEYHQGGEHDKTYSLKYT